MKAFTFTVDDNIIFFKEIAERGYKSLFEHPYLAMYKRLHERFGLKIQLNLFYEDKLGFDLSKFPDTYKNEWEEVCDWLKLSFHSKLENVNPYEFSGYDEVSFDCKNVQSEILRFSSEKTLAKTTTVHYCLTTLDGIRALYDNGVRGLLGLYGKDQNPSVSYMRSEEECERILRGENVLTDGMTYAALDIVLNCHAKEENLRRLDALYGRDLIKLMIHEQYFYEHHPAYQKDFEEKLSLAFEELRKRGYTSVFFEETI